MCRNVSVHTSRGLQKGNDCDTHIQTYGDLDNGRKVNYMYPPVSVS